MRNGNELRRSITRTGFGVLAGAATVVAAALPASAQAGNVIVPHASGPHKVEVHAVPPAPAPASAPAPSPPPPTPSASAPSPASPANPVSSPSPGSGQPADPEDDLPGSDVPPGENDPTYPEQLPSPFGTGCDMDCLQHWHDWYFSRVQTVQGEDAEAAEILRQELAAVNDQIRNGGGVPGAGATDGPPDEPGPSSQGGDSGPATSGPPQSSGPSQTPEAPAAVGGPQSGGSIETIVVDAISGASPIVSNDLGHFDLGEIVEALGAPAIAPTMLVMSIADFFRGGNGAANPGTTECSQKSVDGKVPVCAK